MQPLSDAQVIDLVLAGDRDSFAILVERYETYALRYASVLLKSRQDAQDALSDSFLRAYVNLHKLRGERNFKAWFLTILHNRCYDLLRARSNRWRNETPLDDQPLAAPDDAGGALDRGELQALLSSLSLTERNVLLLKYAYGWDYRDIAKLLKIKEGTLHSIASRAKEKIRQNQKGGETHEGTREKRGSGVLAHE